MNAYECNAYVSCLHTQQGVELHPMMRTGTVMTIDQDITSNANEWCNALGMLQ